MQTGASHYHELMVWLVIVRGHVQFMDGCVIFDEISALVACGIEG